jgi:hypothetical protein
LEPLDAPARIRRMVERYGRDVILTTSFGPTAGVMLKLVTDAMPDMRVVTVVQATRPSGPASSWTSIPGCSSST